MPGSPVQVLSMAADAGGKSHTKSLTSSSDESDSMSNPVCVVSPTVDCFYRVGPEGATIALADGTDQFLFGGASYRIEGVPDGYVFAFISNGDSGDIYFSPGA